MFRVPLLPIAAFLLISNAVAVHASSGTTAPTSREISIREFLSLEGTFDLAAARRSGDNAVLDLSGVSVSLDPQSGLRVRDGADQADVSGSGSWWPGFGQDFNADPLALAVFEGDLYVGGFFSSVGGVSANRIARWDGSAWHPLGTGANSYVRCFAIWNGDLIAGGDFVTIAGVSASRIARYDGTTWSRLGSGANASVRSVAVYQGAVVAGGTFTSAGGIPASRIAKWNGVAWSALGSGLDGTVRALTVHGLDLLAGGSFLHAGALEVNRIARWDATDWHALGTGTDAAVDGLHSWNGDVYVAGEFVTAGGVEVNHIARWDGSLWHGLPVGDGVGFSFGWAQRFGEFEGELVVTGSFYVDGLQYMNSIASWNGVSFRELGPGGVGPGPLITFQSELIVAGGLRANGALADGLHRWNGQRWQTLGPAVDDWVYLIEPYAGGVAVGGLFSSVDQEPAGSIALWDGSDWTPLGSGIDGVAYCATVFNGDLVVGGFFTIAGGTPANYVARWNGSAWSSLGLGTNGMVRTLVVHGGALYAGGNFDHAGGVVANHVARWNGSSWSSVGAGTNGVVYALVSAGALVAGGQFSSAGGSSADNLASWSGSAWSEYHGGTDGPVYSLENFVGAVVAGGHFRQAGSTIVSNVAAWTGAAWNSLGGGVDHVVRALDATASRLVAGGYFAQAGGSGANFVASWDGSNWRALGTGATNGTTGEVRAIHATDTEVLVGGTFRQAGGLGSPYLARWSGTPPFTDSTDGGSEPSSSDSASDTSGGVVGEVDSLNVTLLSFFPIGDYDPWVADVWGYVDGDSEYALVCQGNALTVVDVTDPLNPVLASKVPSLGTDLKGCKTYGHYAYCVNQVGPMQVVDLSDPYSAVSVGLITDHEGGHNCYIDTDRGLLYIASSRNRRGVEIYDLAVDPIDPPRIARHSYLGVHDIHVSGDLAVTCNIGNGNYEMVDVSDPSSPILITRFIHDDPLNPHSAWMNPDRTVVYTCDEIDGGGLHVFDVSNPANPILVDAYNLGPETTIHNVHMQDDRLYISHYEDGLRVLDATDPLHPFEIGYWKSSEFESFGSWGVYPHAPSGVIYFTNMIEAGAGLYLARMSDDPVSVDPSPPMSARIRLDAWPNPVRDGVRLRLTSPTPSQQHPIRVFDAAGRLVRRIELTAEPTHLVDWDGLSDDGRRVPSGRYYLSWGTDAQIVTRSIVVAR